MTQYNNTWLEQSKNENWRENLANIFEEGATVKVKDSNRLNGLSLDELVSYINLEHNTVDTLTELSDTSITNLSSSDLLYYSGSNWTNANVLPLDIHVQSTSGSREIKIESTSGTSSSQSIKLKQPDVEWKIEHKRTANNSNGLEISDGSNAWKFETTGALRFNALNSEPANHHKGSMYYNESENNFYVALSNTQTTP